MSHLRKAALVLGIVSLISIGVFVGRSSEPVAGQNKSVLDKAGLVQKVQQSPDRDINFTNFAGVPVVIERATTKEISAREYEQLTGVKSASAMFAAFPNVSLRNGTTESVTSLSVMVGNRRTSKNYSMNFSKISLRPGEHLLIKSGQWRPEQAEPETGSDSASRNAPKTVDFDSERMWWPGGAAASDLVLRIVRVQFESGRHWLIDSASGGDSW